MEQTKKLPKEFKNKWIAALRSGEYIQGKEFLMSSNSIDREFDEDGNEIFVDTPDIQYKFCCIGVAGFICGIPKLRLFKNPIFASSEDWSKEELETIPELLRGGCLREISDYNEIVDDLTQMNDSGKTFQEIADYIENNL